MAALRAEGHYGREVEIDLCEPCRLVWFDGLESVNLAGPGWISLLECLALEDPALLPWSGREIGCPRCRQPLRAVHNRTRWGRFVALECPRREGCLQSHALLLAERGLVRPPTPRERHAASRAGGWPCLNCGAPVEAAADECGHCRTPMLMVDLPRLAEALRPSPADRATVSAGRPLAWPCAGCGQALDPTVTPECTQCGQAVFAPTLADLAPLLAALRDEWRALAAAREAAAAARALARERLRRAPGA